MRREIMKYPNHIRLTIYGASVCAAFLIFLFPVTDYDIWWHLTEGKLMLKGQFPYTEVFSYTAGGATNLPNSWGFSALAWLGYQVFGLDGINFIKALIATGVFTVVGVHLFLKGKLNAFSLAFLLLAFFSIREGFSLRPHTLSYLWLALFLLGLERYREKRTWRWIAFLVGIEFLWVNSHASFVWGLALAGIYTIFEIIIHIQQKNNNLKTLSTICYLLSAIFAASLAHLFYGPGYIFRIITEYFDPAARIPIREALPISLESMVSVSGALVLSSLLLVLWGSVRTKEFDRALGALFFVAAGALNARFERDMMIFLAFTAPLSFPLLASLLGPRLAVMRAKISFPVPQWARNTAFLLFACLLVFAAYTSALGVGLGMEKFSYPVEAVKFLQNEKILEKSQGNLYHTYNFGGYLIFANQPHKVFLDGRTRPYLGEVFSRYWANFEGTDAWRDSIERYNITAALMTLPHTDGTTTYNQSAPMFPREKWALIYYDDIAILYVRRDDLLRGLINMHEYKILNPQHMDFAYLGEFVQSQETFEQALGEVDRGLLLNPDSYRLHFTRAYVLALAGNEELMRQELETTLRINPHFQAAKNILKTLPAE